MDANCQTPWSSLAAHWRSRQAQRSHAAGPQSTELCEQPVAPISATNLAVAGSTAFFGAIRTIGSLVSRRLVSHSWPPVLLGMWRRRRSGAPSFLALTRCDSIRRRVLTRLRSIARSPALNQYGFCPGREPRLDFIIQDILERKSVIACPRQLPGVVKRASGLRGAADPGLA